MATIGVRVIWSFVVIICCIGDAAEAVTSGDRNHDTASVISATHSSSDGCRCLAINDRISCDWCDGGGLQTMGYSYQPHHEASNNQNNNNNNNQNNRIHHNQTGGYNCWSESRDPVAAVSCQHGGLEAFPTASVFHSDQPVVYVDLRHNFISWLDEDTMPPSTTRSLLHLRLADNRIRRIDGAATFSRAPWRRTLRTLDLSGNQLTRIERSTFSGFVSGELARLDLSANRLERIEVGSFSSLSTLSRLDLSGNQLSELHAATFDGLTSLAYLLLTGNRIRVIDSVTFRPLERLVYVVLRGNPLGQQLDNTQFISPFLSYVDLSECRLTTLPRDGVLPPSVRYLQLRRNNITSLRRRSPGLRRLESLAVLVLDDNLIERVDSGAMLRLVHLEQLWLNGNRLTTVPRRLPADLRRLLMDFNHVDNLTDAQMFQASSKLTSLSLMSNHIADVTAEALAPLTSLRTLDLANNRLRHVTAGLFKHQSSLRTLQLSGNPLDRIDRSALSGLNSLTALRLSYVPDVMAINADFLTDVSSTLVRLEVDNSPALAQFVAGRIAIRTPDFDTSFKQSGSELVETPPPLNAAAFPHIRYFSAASSDLVRLSPGFALGLDPTASVRLSSTKWQCDRRVAWLRDWIRASKPTSDVIPAGNHTSTSAASMRPTRDHLVLGVQTLSSISTPSPLALENAVLLRTIPPFRNVDDSDNQCATPRSLLGRAVASLADNELDDIESPSPTSGYELVYTVIRVPAAMPDVTSSSARHEVIERQGDDERSHRSSWSSSPAVVDNIDYHNVPDIEDFGSGGANSSHRTVDTAASGIDYPEYDDGERPIVRDVMSATEPETDTNFLGEQSTTHVDVATSSLHVRGVISADYDSSSLQRMRGTDFRSLVLIGAILTATVLAVVAMVTVIVRLVRGKKLVVNGNVVACGQKDGGVLYFARRSPPDVVVVGPAAAADRGVTRQNSATSGGADQKLRVYKWEDF